MTEEDESKVYGLLVELAEVEVEKWFRLPAGSKEIIQQLLKNIEMNHDPYE